MKNKNITTVLFCVQKSFLKIFKAKYLNSQHVNKRDELPRNLFIRTVYDKDCELYDYDYILVEGAWLTKERYLNYVRKFNKDRVFFFGFEPKDKELSSLIKKDFKLQRGDPFIAFTRLFRAIKGIARYPR